MASFLRWSNEMGDMEELNEVIEAKEPWIGMEKGGFRRTESAASTAGSTSGSTGSKDI